MKENCILLLLWRKQLEIYRKSTYNLYRKEEGVVHAATS